MGTEIFLIAVILLMGCAVMDLVVGVSNDAVNFLNSSLGSKVAPRWVILAVASFGILAGVTFSSGMMEVARKGIFNPQFFTMPDLIMIFFAVMLTDILLLDLFNTYGLPTSTTVSIVFELLGAAVGVSLVKIAAAHGQGHQLGDYINTAKALVIISGILLSVVISFIAGAIAQFIARLIFTFDYMSRLRRYGALWGGVAVAFISYFILIKGAKGASFLTAETEQWIRDNALTIMGGVFVISAVGFQILILFFRVNILKPIILMGTFALAMAFAANDLVNFIGVPMAGMNAYKAALASGDPLNASMTALSQKVPTQTYLLLLAGAIMVGTLWFSRKSRTVSQTELTLGRQGEGIEKYESIFLSRIIVRMVSGFFDTGKHLVPERLREFIAIRTDPSSHTSAHGYQSQSSFDLLRASVNLMMASIVISYATSLKLPLSTTYVTFMVSMGSSFSDRAWGTESAVFRVTGVLTVIGGWFMTALIAFTVSFIFANVLFHFKIPGAVLLIVLIIFAVRKTHRMHGERVKQAEGNEIFTIEHVRDGRTARNTSFAHMAFLIKEIRTSLDNAIIALFTADLIQLRREKRQVKQIQIWINVIIANIFKVLRAMQQEKAGGRFNYAQTIRRLQKMSDAYRDIVLRSYVHISNHHKEFLQEQKEEILQVKNQLMAILSQVEDAISRHAPIDDVDLKRQNAELEALTDKLDARQINRIGAPDSKTRLSILYYAIIGDCKVISRQNMRLLDIFNQSFFEAEKSENKK